jgi:hypothetical protein
VREPTEREWLEGLRYEDKFPDLEPCPMGCGRTTEDVYGGPCKACWDAVPDTEEER